MSFATEQIWKNKLLQPRLIHTDIFIQGLEPDEVEMLKEAFTRGLKPAGFKVVGDTLILGLTLEED